MLGLPGPSLHIGLVETAGRLGLRPPDLPPVLSGAMPKLIEPLGKLPGLRRSASRLAINFYASAAKPRPRPLTLREDYTTWRGLTDRTWTGRHLPPATDEYQAALPSESEVLELFRRDEQIPARDTSAMFMFFAQWFTDSFLRTRRDDPRRNTSNHEIDLCQIYGLSEEQTRMLRELDGGRLRTQRIDGEEFPQFLFAPREAGERPTVKPEFAGLHDEAFLIDTILGDASDAHTDAVFAVGLEHGNSTIGQTFMNVTFFREHNRIARHLADEYPDWDDDRLFETTRNVMIAITLKLVVEEYIRHIAPFDFPVEAVPLVAESERWNRSNWCAMEFNLLYRWHPLVPDAIGEGPDAVTWSDFLNNNPLVLERGVEALMAQCSRSPAGRIGLRNTPRFLTERKQADRPAVEERSISMARGARLRSFNEYREAFSLSRLDDWDELTDDEELRDRLEAMYGDIDALEWYVGIFAEDYPDYMMMGELLTTMVAHDAFTQALTNPLLGAQVFNEDTFSPAGMRILEETSSLQQIVARNARDPEAVLVSFSR
jgi:prostaglandin-endoperoxide synthase 2